jgi:branched-chain amino acid transport system permease protein
MVQQVVNGLALGSMYALVALGYTLTLGVLRLLNLAHGEVFMLGGFVGGALLVSGVPLPLVLLGAAVGAGVMGLVVEWLCFRPMGHEQELTPALATVVLGIIIVELAVKIWGSEPYNLPSALADVDVGVGGLKLSLAQVVIILLALALMAALDVAVRRTELGRAMRAVSESATDATLTGINTRRIVTVTFVVSSALGGIAGLLLAWRTGVASVTVGLQFGLKALAVMAIGGLGHLRGAMLGGIVLGLVEALSFQWGLGSYSDLVVWAALVLTLIVRPGGLFGTTAASVR